MEPINILSWYGPLAIGLFLFGTFWRIARSIKIKRGYGIKSENPYPPGRKRMRGVLEDTIIKPFSVFGAKANRFWFTGFALFHIGMIILLGHSMFAGAHAAMYLAEGDVNLQQLPEKIFEDAESVPDLLIPIRKFSLAAIVTGILILLTSKISGNTIAMRSYIDDPTKKLKIKTRGIKRLMDVYLLLLILLIVIFGILTSNTGNEEFLTGHILLTLTLLAITPYTTLFHFIYGYWIGIIYGISKRRDGTTA